MSDLDNRDFLLMSQRQKKRLDFMDTQTHPVVGDIIDLGDGDLRAVAIDLYAPESIQLTVKGTGFFYMGVEGSMSFSGCIAPSIPVVDLVRDGSGEVRVWFFHYDMWEANNAVNATTTVAKWKRVPPTEVAPM